MSEGRLCFKIDRSPVDSLLEDDVILNNIKECDKTYDTQYMMSACTAWLRKNKGKTLADFEKLLLSLSLGIRIVAIELQEEDFDICLPGGSSKPLQYVGIWIGKEDVEFAKDSIDEENSKRLEIAGFTCNKGMAKTLENCDPPTMTQIRNADIKYQLQWAGMKVTINRVEPEKLLQKDINYYRRIYFDEIKRLPIHRSESDEVYAYAIKDNKGNYESISEFGIKKDLQTGEEIEIHILAYFLEKQAGTANSQRPIASNAENRNTLNQLIQRQVTGGESALLQKIELIKTMDNNGKQIVALVS